MIMKSIIFVVISFCITLASAKRIRRGLSRREVNRINQLKFPQDPKCGLFSGEVNIDNPDEFEKRNFPWMISVIRKNDTKHLCDGVLIYPDILLTSVHCVENYHHLGVTTKAIERASKSINSDKYEREVSNIIVYQSYELCSRHNNLAMLILSQPFILDDQINVICLPNLGLTYYTNHCVTKLTENKETLDYEWDHNHCGDRVFIAPNSSYSMGKASCDQGDETSSLIRQTKSYLLLCQLPWFSNKFYFLGLMVNVTMCGPDLENYYFYDTLYKFMIWMHSILEKHFIDYELDKIPVDLPIKLH